MLAFFGACRASGVKQLVVALMVNMMLLSGEARRRIVSTISWINFLERKRVLPNDRSNGQSSCLEMALSFASNQ